MLGALSTQFHGHLPLSLDVALAILGLGVVMFLTVVYDLYRYVHDQHS